MNRIATLGPAGTFSELAAKKYIETFDKSAEITFYSTITKVFNGIAKECELGIIPIENTLDGYVQLTLDLLSQTDFNIIYETVVPIQFSIVSNTLGISDIKKIYVQFKTQGQCYNFLEQVTNAKVITTESNGESFQKVERGILGQAAIIPRHMLKASNKFSFNIENVTDNVTDSEENDTRFIVLSKDTIKYDINRRYKTSIIVMDAADNKPGALSKILNEFSEKNINLTSIMSRPTKKALGKYYFFIDIDGHYPEEKSVKEVIDKISKNNIVKILGSYSLV